MFFRKFDIDNHRHVILVCLFLVSFASILNGISVIAHNKEIKTMKVQLAELQSHPLPQQQNQIKE